MQRPDFKYQIVLYEPEIPPNTGNAGRLCVATQSSLHLIGKLGFNIDDKQVRRAGLDYWKYVDLHQHASFDDWLSYNSAQPVPFYLLSKKATRSIFDVKLPKQAAFIFGKETLGLPDTLLDKYADQTFTIPMFSTQIRSLNLSNAVSITLYEAIRQNIK